MRSSHIQSQGIVDTIEEPLLVLDERGHVLDANRAFFSTFLVERDDTIDRPLRELGSGQWNVPDLIRLVSDVIPKSKAVVDYEIVHEFPNIGKRTFLLTARRLWKPDGNSTQILLAFEDVTSARSREREQALLLSEVRHRLKNLLGIVEAIAQQTSSDGRTADDYKASLLSRLGALTKVQSLLANEGTTEIGSLAHQVVGGLGEGRLRIEGPAVDLADEQVVPVTMIFHELGSNALKYEAFSGDSGSVRLSWELKVGPANSVLQVTWHETCGFPVTKPDHASVGTNIITSCATVGLHGSADLDFASDGLVARFAFPLEGEGR